MYAIRVLRGIGDVNPGFGHFGGVGLVLGDSSY
jgi:hypothetical protein